MINTFKSLVAAIAIGGLLTIGSTATAADSPNHGNAAKPGTKAKPYPLKTCVVSGENFGGDMGEPYAFTHEGREIKLCCKGCLKSFNKEPAKYVKKLEAAEKEPKTSKPAAPAPNHAGHQR